MPVTPPPVSDHDYSLGPPQNEQEWQAYHDIRRDVLFEKRGRHGIYDANRPEEYSDGHHSLLLKFQNTPIGTVRLDATDILGDDDDTCYIVRLVAIKDGLQGHGHGKKLDALTNQYARNLGATRLLVNAAETAYGYYQKTGWRDFQWDITEVQAAFEPVIQMHKYIPPSKTEA